VQKSEIERLAQGVLNVREKFNTRSLASLYDPNFMPKDLREAHKALDKAVMKLYGFAGLGEAEIVAGLMGRYSEMSGVGNDNYKIKEYVKSMDVAVSLDAI